MPVGFAAWSIKTADGRLSPFFVSYTKTDVERKVVGTEYDLQALNTDRSYRAKFETELKQELQEHGWQIVPIWLTDRES